MFGRMWALYCGTGGAWAEQTRAMARPAKTKFRLVPLDPGDGLSYICHLRLARPRMCQVAAAPTLESTYLGVYIVILSSYALGSLAQHTLLCTTPANFIYFFSLSTILQFQLGTSS
jgi:hypothetical protein